MDMKELVDESSLVQPLADPDQPATETTEPAAADNASSEADLTSIEQIQSSEIVQDTEQAAQES